MEAKSLWVLLTTLLFIIQGWRQTEGCLEQERIALFQLKSFFNGNYSLKDWVNVKGSNCCEWEGVECNITTERVIGLYLNFARQWDNREWISNPYGYLNVSLFLPFEELKSLELSGNEIADLVDNQVSVSSAFNNLEILVLTQNYFNDSILSSEKVQPMMNIEVLNLDYNFLNNNDLAYLKGLSSLKSLSIGGNQLEGAAGITVLNNLTKLNKLDLSDNKIDSLQSSHDGERPLNLTNLEELNLDENSFTNNLLAQLSGFSNLKSSSIRNNQLKGSINIKELLDTLSNLEELDMSGNEVKEFVPIKNKENGSLGKLKVANLNGVFNNGAASLIQLLETFSSVNTIHLRGNYFNDTFSTQDQLHVPSKIEELVLDRSSLNNNIFQSIGVLASLKILSLSGCGLSGTLPTQGWCDLRKFEVLDLSENALKGTLPSCLANLSSLHYLDISGNQFVGKGASTALANLTLLRFISLSRNLFEVPSIFISFANHSHLKVLSSNQNKLVEEPTIPTWVPKFQLKAFRLSNCTTNELHIEIPKFLYYQNNLSIIDLSYNNFEGKVPFWLLENNTRMEAFLMKGNSFIGHLNLPSHPNPKISFVDISDNKIQGPIPVNICSIFPQLNGLNLAGNSFQGNIPPCLGSLTTSNLLLDLSHN
ncbi:receptor-like protein 13 isoform X2 [Gossypium arboreum]|uniref:receptor-like protein 13 isoform X2 n=1 Tax=Gossypium arboreum TaxID=29729 RepID=UPI0022F182A2|nr:receptor-like protein 13 isoform X2 [Gossypium arboreum]